MKVEFDGQRMKAEMNEGFTAPSPEHTDVKFWERTLAHEHVGIICGITSLAISVFALLMGMVFNYATNFLYDSIGQSALYYAITGIVVCMVVSMISILLGVVSIVTRRKCNTTENMIGMFLSIIGIATCVTSLVVKIILFVI